MFSAIISASLLLLPVFLLFLVSMPRIAMVILVFGFVVVFTVVLSVIAEGRPQEILVGVAAYVFAFPHISKADILLVILRSLPPSWAIWIKGLCPLSKNDQASKARWFGIELNEVVGKGWYVSDKLMAGSTFAIEEHVRDLSMRVSFSSISFGYSGRSLHSLVFHSQPFILRSLEKIAYLLSPLSTHPFVFSLQVFSCLRLISSSGRSSEYWSMFASFNFVVMIDLWLVIRFTAVWVTQSFWSKLCNVGTSMWMLQRLTYEYQFRQLLWNERPVLVEVRYG